MYVLRIWALCHQRKRGSLDGVPETALKEICRWPGEAAELVRILKEARFLDEEDGVLIAHDWEEENSQLLKKWDAGRFGKKGGRPKKNPTVTNQETLGFSNNNPRVLKSETLPKPDGLDGLERERDKKEYQKAETSDDVSSRPRQMELVQEDKLSDLAAIYGKAKVDRALVQLRGWLTNRKNRGKKCTRARLVNWLNRMTDDVEISDAGQVDPITGIRRVA